MTRGRLIFPFLAKLHRLDTAAMGATDVDGAGPLTSGYDPDFKEPVGVDITGDGIGERVRLELPALRVPCQVEPKAFEEVRMFAAGNSPRSRIELVFHFSDLERLGLVAEDGEALIRPSDRLSGLYDRTGALIQEIHTPPGLYVTETRPLGFGLNRRRAARNLLLIVLGDRQRAGRTT